MAEYGCSVHADEIVITNGCQEALTLALRTVTVPGDVVAIESPTFYGLLQAIESLGLVALEIPTHPRDGISLEALQLALEQWPVKACIAVPNYSNPLGHCMPEERKQRLVDLLQEQRVSLIEDDVYGDLGFSQRRPFTCKARYTTGTVLYCASFSKSLSPGLRVGWILPGRYQEKVEYLKYVTSLATPTVPQLAAAQLLESGVYERHLRKVRVEYARAVERMIEAVDRYFPEGTKVTRPQGGFVLWIELAADVDSFELSRKLLARGISIAPGPIFSASQKYRNFVRLSCACEWSNRVERALASIARLI
jgi:DNA-binding transcriptional MocR family regulator